nr:hypothetical protein [Tanacetum cinerariifolium]
MVIMKLKERIVSLSGNLQKEKIKQELEDIETINIELDHRVTKLVTENEHLKQTYKKLYDSIKSLRIQTKNSEKVLVITALKDTLRKLKGKAIVDEAVTLHPIDPELLKIDVASLAPKLQNNRTAHYDYLKHTQKETATLREIVESERLLNTVNTSLDYACKYTKQIQELLIILKQTCPCINDLGDKLMDVTPVNKTKKIRFIEPITSSGNIPIKIASSLNVVSNKPMLSSTGVNLPTSASGSQPSSNTKKDRIQHTQSRAKKNKLEPYLRNVKTSLHNKKSVVNTKDIASVPNLKLNVKSDLQCVMCNGCLFSDNHDSCVLEFINSVNARVKSKSAKKPLNRKIWKPTRKVFTNIGYKWRPTGRTFTIVRNACPLTRIITTAKVPLRKPIPLESNTSKPVVVQIVLWYLDSGCSKHMTKDLEVAKIMGYADYKIGLWNVTISRVYFVEGLGHNLISVGQFCDSDLEVAFRDMLASSPICLLSKASKTKSWLWNQRLSHLNFVAINRMARQGLVRGLLKLKFEKDHLYSACAMGKNNGTEFVNQTLREYYEQVSISHETSVAHSPQQNGVVERRNRKLIEAARTIKTPYELMHNKLLDLSFLPVFGALCYPTNDSENLGKLQPKADIRIFIGYAPTKKAFWIYNRPTRRIIETIYVNFDELTAMASEQGSSGPVLHEMTPATISSGLVPKPTSSTSFVPPSRNDWDLLFQPLFDELLTPSPSVDPPALTAIAPIAEVIAPEPAESTGSPSSTTVDQDAPSPSKSQTTPETQPHVITQDVEEDNHDIEVAHMGNDPLFGMPIPKVASDQSSSTYSTHTIMHPDH